MTAMRVLRFLSGETIAHASKSVGVVRSHYASIERGAVDPTPDTVRRIEEHFKDWSIDALLDDVTAEILRSLRQASARAHTIQN
jgi:predicted transcriptional regulator